jgi:dienelactone hydrolase
VLRYDKRGAAIGESTGKYLSVGTNDNNLEILADDVVAGVEYVKSLDLIDSDRIGVMGLSQAGWIVPLAASKSDDIAFFEAFSGHVMSVGQEFYYSELIGDVMGEGARAP